MRYDSNSKQTKADIGISPTLDDLMIEMKEIDRSAAPLSDGDDEDSGMVFNLFIEGESPESITEESDDEPEVQVAPVATEVKKAQEAEELADGDFLALAATGDVDFYDKTVTDRLAALARKYTAPESAYLALIMQARTAAKNVLIAELEKKLAR